MQLNFFGGTEPLKITKPIRLIELFGGIGCQAQALKNIGANFEHYRLCEFDKYAVASYNAIHGTSFKKSDIRDWSGGDLGLKRFLNNITRTETQIPLCSAKHNSIVIPVLEKIFKELL